MLIILARERPDDAVIGEEFGQKHGTSRVTWVLDPIDGTRAYVCGAPTWGVLIAATIDGVPEIGVIDQPFISERFWGAQGRALYRGPHGEREIVTSHCTALSDAILASTFPEIGTPEERSRFEQVASCVKLTRYGMDCYAYALLAAGHIDLVIEAGLKPYDIHAPIALIRAAGGVVTNWEGGPPEAGGQIIAAANQQLLQAALLKLKWPIDHEALTT